MGAREQAQAPAETVVDSDVLIWYLRGTASAASFLESIPYGNRRLPAVVYMELVRGCRNRTELRRLKRFLRTFFPRVEQISEEVSRRALSLVERYALSHSIAVDDALIAATALAVNSRLATGNTRDYSFIPGLKLLPYQP